MLSNSQLQYISACVDSFVGNPGLYYNLPTTEHRRLTEELAYSPIGTIIEAYAPLADAITGANRRYFWKKNPDGIFQVITNHEVNAMHSVVFNP